MPQNDTPYRLVRYMGDRDEGDEDFWVRLATPVLFVPGHFGDYQQARSLGAHLRGQGLNIELYTLDLLHEPTALHAGLIWQQAHFTSVCVQYLAGLHSSSSSMIMVGHSYGAIVIQTALVLPSFPVGRVTALITLGAPHQDSPIHLDRSIATFYDRLRLFWRVVTPPPPAAPTVAAAKAELKGNNSTGRGMWDTMLQYVPSFISGRNSTEANTSAPAVEVNNAAQNANDDKSSGKDASGVEACVPDPAGEKTCDPSSDQASSSSSSSSSSAADVVRALSANARKSKREQHASTIEAATQQRKARQRYSNARLSNLALVSISGGSGDEVVPEHLSSLEGVAPPSQAWHTTLPALRGGVDHVALLWCAQVQAAVARAIGAAIALPPSATAAARLKAIKANFFNSSTTTDSTTAAAAAAAAADAAAAAASPSLSSTWSWQSVTASLSEPFLSLVTTRFWLAVPVWTSMGMAILAAPLLHALLDVANPPVRFPDPALLVAPSLHWPLVLLKPAWAALLEACTPVPKGTWPALAGSAAAHVLLSVYPSLSTGNWGGEDNTIPGVDGMDADISNAGDGDAAPAWHARVLAFLATQGLVALQYLGAMVLNLVSTPAFLLFSVMVNGAALFLAPLVLYGALLLVLAVAEAALAFLQRCSSRAWSAAWAVFAKPLAVVSSGAAAVGRLSQRLRAALPFGLGEATGDDSERKSGDDLRDAFRAQRQSKAAAAAAGGNSFGSGGAWAALFHSPLVWTLVVVYAALHVQSVAPLVVRGLVSWGQPSSFAHELALWTAFAVAAIAVLLVSFLVVPAGACTTAAAAASSAGSSGAVAAPTAAAMSDLTKYHRILVLLYAPLVPLCAGALAHARAVLSRPPTASALVYSTAASLTFDAVLDAALLFAVLSHLVLARTSPLPLPAPLRNVEGFFPKLLASQDSSSSKSSSNGSSSSGGSGESDRNKMIVVASTSTAPGQVWVRRYEWRTGETYYEETSSGKLLYPDGGPDAIFEVSDLDSQALSHGKSGNDLVVMGPGFQVVQDNSLGDAFKDMWGTPFAATRAEQQFKAAVASAGGRSSSSSSGNSGSSYAAVVEAALESPEAWFVAALYGLVAFVGVAGLSRAFHAFSGLGITAALLAWRHLLLF